MKKLNFLTAGLPRLAENQGYEKGFQVLKDLELDGMELEFVHGVRISDQSKALVKKAKDFIFTAHAPFYINLNSKEDDKIEASIQRIIETADMGKELNAYSITFHAAFYMGKSQNDVFKKVEEGLSKISANLEEKNNDIWIRPETTGKATQWGDLDEIIMMSKLFKNVLPCVDFSHLHARYGGTHNTYDEFAGIFEKIGKELGNKALENFHAHIAGIAYSLKGEKNHLNLLESDMNYKDLLKAFKDFDVKGVITCESPNIEEDTKLLRDYFYSI